MTDAGLKKLSLHEIRQMKREGRLHHNPLAEAGPELAPDFWDRAQLITPEPKVSVHLKLDPDVFAFFKASGKGHLTRMQDVLKTYVKAVKR